MSFLTQTALAILPHLTPETARKLTVRHLDWATTLGYTADITRVPAEDPVTVMGLRFPNRIGLAAGFDKEGTAVSALGSFGFGHVEVGTVFPKGHRSEPRHRIRRFNKDEAVTEIGHPDGIGLTAVEENLKSAQAYKLRGGILGINLPLSDLTPDTVIQAARSADYLTLNTDGLSAADITDHLTTLTPVFQEKHCPVALKLSPDLEDATFLKLLDIAADTVDALVLTGATQLGALGPTPLPAGTRLSGAPLKERALSALRTAAEHLDGALPLIASGGILSENDVVERLDAGALLVQLFSGFIFHGPLFTADCADAAAHWAQKS